MEDLPHAQANETEESEDSKVLDTDVRRHCLFMYGENGQRTLSIW